MLFAGQNRLFEMVADSAKNEDSKEVCIVVFFALFENHLRSLVWSRCVRLKIEPPVIDLLLKGFERVERRQTLFEKLTGIKIQDELKKENLWGVFETYQKLRTKRNGAWQSRWRIGNYGSGRSGCCAGSGEFIYMLCTFTSQILLGRFATFAENVSP